MLPLALVPLVRRCRQGSTLNDSVGRTFLAKASSNEPHVIRIPPRLYPWGNDPVPHTLSTLPSAARAHLPTLWCRCLSVSSHGPALPHYDVGLLAF